jgi:hypothetical protein
MGWRKAPEEKAKGTWKKKECHGLFEWPLRPGVERASRRGPDIGEISHE